MQVRDLSPNNYPWPNGTHGEQAPAALQATAVADRWGTASYGTLSGFFSAPITAATALAPWAGTALAESMGSYTGAFGLLAGGVVAAALLAWRGRPKRLTATS